MRRYPAVAGHCAAEGGQKGEGLPRSRRQEEDAITQRIAKLWALYAGGLMVARRDR